MIFTMTRSPHFFYKDCLSSSARQICLRLRILSTALLLATSLLMAPAIPLPEERGFGGGLVHACVDIHAESEEGHPVIMLHGLTGTKETWDGIYENISLLTQRRVCIYDARNHGDSEWSNDFNVDVLADDLGSFMNSMNIEKATLVGHSLGGLTAMKFALKNPNRVEKLFIEDISPISIPKDTVEGIISFLKLLMSSLIVIPDGADEETAEKTVTDYIYQVTSNPPPEHLFKKYPFRCHDGVWQWKSNFNVFIKAFDDTDAFIGKMEGCYYGNVFFIYGKASFFNVAGDVEEIRKLFPNAEFYGVEDASHVIHSQHPEFQAELVKFLTSEDLRENPPEQIVIESTCL